MLLRHFTSSTFSKKDCVMLSAALVLEIRRLLDEGELSQRAIARKLSVSRGTVANIANGRRGLHGADEDREGIGDEPPAAPRRCRGCGGMVYEPCLLCRARGFRRRVEESRRLARKAARLPLTPRNVA
jgi:predicted XRE-type DNA-binding protein